MKKLTLRAYKSKGYEGCPSVVHKKAISTLKRRKCKNKPPSEVIRLPDVFHTLSWLFHLNKREAWVFIKELERYGLIQLIPYQGVRIRALALEEVESCDD